MEPIKRKITIIGESFEFVFKKDYTEYAKCLIEVEANKLDENNIYDYFREGEFTDGEVESLNGEHFLFGFLESLGQSDKCPENLFNSDKPLKYKVEAYI